VTGVSFVGRVQPPDQFCDSTDPVRLDACTPEYRNAIQFAPLTQRITFNITGVGNCEQGMIDFGDGEFAKIFNVTSWPVQEQHAYFGWPGVKNVRVKGLVNCAGEVTVPLNVGRLPDGRQGYVLGFVPNGSVCNAVPDVPQIKAGTVVRLEANDGKIRYGLPEFDASGDRASTAPADYAFPQMRPFSLVYRVGSQAVQGEVGRVIFRATDTAPLEVCVNDHPQLLGDNISSTGVRIDISVAFPPAGP
jgi:hypothetical protein